EDSKTSVKVSKQDATNHKELPGAKIQILDSKNEVVREWTSGTEPKVIEGLKAGETYTLHEEVAPNGYTVASDTTFVISEDGTVTTTGSKTSDGALLINDKREMTKVTVTKTWSESSDILKAYRPKEGVRFNLYADGVFKAWCKIMPDIDGSWPGYTFVNLPAWAGYGTDNFHKIAYTVEEVAPGGYTSSNTAPVTTDSGITVAFTNTLIEKTSVSGVKVWNDNENAAKVRPESVTIRLMQEGINDPIDSVTVKETDNWSFEFTDLPKFDDGGSVINYYIDEVAVNGYTKEITEANGTFTVTNSLENLTSVKVTKIWNDNNNVSKVRPASIKLNLLQDNEQYGSATVEAQEGNTWTYTFTDLPKYADDGHAYIYTVAEETVNKYVPSYSTDTLTITNTITGTTSVSGTKTWVDGNKTHTNKDEIVLTLTRVSAKADSKFETVSAEVTWSGNTYTFANLAKYDAEGYE
ncbi:MAG: Cna B-type domain-containing protein, partial [Clostridia bacterium]|nr:Cna B-type domain-containing protein [Clostridia bacterium]